MPYHKTEEPKRVHYDRKALGWNLRWHDRRLKEEAQAAAAASPIGLSLNQYVLTAVMEKLEREGYELDSDRALAQRPVRRPAKAFETEHTLTVPSLEASDVHALLDDIDEKYPGLARYPHLYAVGCLLLLAHDRGAIDDELAELLSTELGRPLLDAFATRKPPGFSRPRVDEDAHL